MIITKAPIRITRLYRYFGTNLGTPPGFSGKLYEWYMSSRWTTQIALTDTHSIAILTSLLDSIPSDLRTTTFHNMPRRALQQQITVDTPVVSPSTSRIHICSYGNFDALHTSNIAKYRWPKVRNQRKLIRDIKQTDAMVNNCSMALCLRNEVSLSTMDLHGYPQRKENYVQHMYGISPRNLRPDHTSILPFTRRDIGPKMTSPTASHSTHGIGWLHLLVR